MLVLAMEFSRVACILQREVGHPTSRSEVAPWKRNRRAPWRPTLTRAESLSSHDRTVRE